jgi:hypothetical protein
VRNFYKICEGLSYVLDHSFLHRSIASWMWHVFYATPVADSEKMMRKNSQVMDLRLAVANLIATPGLLRAKPLWRAIWGHK